MIAFSCHQCGKQFTLKPDFAGRKTTCSGCKELLFVPSRPEAGPPVVREKISFWCNTCGMKFSVKSLCW